MLEVSSRKCVVQEYGVGRYGVRSSCVGPQ